MRAGPLAGARALLGWELVAGPCRARLVEVEAYGGADDPGSHAWRGRTPRNAPMFGPPGGAYVYFNYGMHWLLNVAAEAEGVPAAVLLRAAEPLDGWEEFRRRRPRARGDADLLAGPGRLAQAFGLDGRLNGADLLDPDAPVRLCPPSAPPPARVWTGPRVGLAVGRGEDLPWRLVDPDRRAWASRPRPPASADG